MKHVDRDGLNERESCPGGKLARALEESRAGSKLAVPSGGVESWGHTSQTPRGV